MTLKQWTAVKS